MKNKYDMKYIDERIEAMIIAKLSHYRLKVRDLVSKRHTADYPDLHYISVTGAIRDLRVWMQIAKLIGNKDFDDFVPSEPYTVYMAKKLTN